MKHITFLLALAALVAGTALRADTLVFRSGEIMAAELTRDDPKVSNLDETAFDFKFATRAYCLITVRPTAGRTLGTTDYSLDIFGRRYACVAIRVDDGTFDAAVREIGETNTINRYGLLFIVDGSVVSADRPEELALLCNAPGEVQPLTVPFTNLGKRAFTAGNRIPNSGAFKLSPAGE